MRTRDPRKAIASRRRARARVQILEAPDSRHAPDGSVDSMQVAQVTLPRAELERLWTPEYLERLARTYWRFLTRISLGLLRVLYTPDSRQVVLLTRPFVLLRFHRPEYEVGSDFGSVTWRIERGVLVAPAGRGRGYLKLSVFRRSDGDEPPSGDAKVTVISEVENFYPMIAGWGWFSRIGRAIYRATQLRLHVVVTNAFLRSLARLDLEPSVVGALKAPSPQAPR
ncbi:MAG TPA: hypothetical protein VHG69_12440 [Thermoleophilaceae bacterium]|nr:hypothetical protein [Thermoleophilaceae bacterium]